MLTPIGSKVLDWIRPGKLRKAADPEAAVQDMVTLSRPRSSPGPWRQLGMVAAVVLAVKFAGPLAYHLDPIQPDASQISVQVDQAANSACAPSGRIIPGTPAERGKLERVQSTLQHYSHRPEINYRFVISQMKQPNAESCAGGMIGLDQEIVSGLDEQELLFVAAHEQGHVEGRDHAKLQSFQQQAISRQFNMLSWLPGYDQAMENDLLHHARGNETGADCYALGVLRAEGIPAAKAASALQKVEAMVERRLGHATSGGGHGDHPETSQRIEHLLQGCSG